MAGCGGDFSDLAIDLFCRLTAADTYTEAKGPYNHEHNGLIGTSSCNRSIHYCTQDYSNKEFSFMDCERELIEEYRYEQLSRKQKGEYRFASEAYKKFGKECYDDYYIWGWFF
jgi:hypothetical protein